MYRAPPPNSFSPFQPERVCGSAGVWVCVCVEWGGAVRWPPIGSSSPLTPWYAWNVLPFCAQSQPARFQVETRVVRKEEGGEGKEVRGRGVENLVTFKTTLGHGYRGFISLSDS